MVLFIKVGCAVRLESDGHPEGASAPNAHEVNLREVAVNL